jgi:S1-C subfamily serine protease
LTWPPGPKVQGLSKKITQGIVNGYRSERQNAQDVGYLQISAEESKGNSGGPVFAADGSMIGLVQR